MKYHSIVFILLFIFLVAAKTNAAIFTVTKTADTNDGVCNADCSLREAFAAANAAASADTINFDTDIFSTAQTITLSGAELINGTDNSPANYNASGDLTINGTGADLLSISGNNASRVIYNQNSLLTITGVTITGGNGVSSFDNGLGGGINNSGQLNLNDSIVTGNTTDLGGGGIYTGASRVLNINNSSVSNNTARNGGGIYYSLTGGNITNSNINANMASGGGGGIFVSTGNINITASNITNNKSSGGGGIYNIGGGTMTINNSAVIATQAVGTGGGIYNGNTLNLNNSTISSNTANPLNFTIGGGGIDNNGTLNLTASTLSNNAALNSTYGGGIINRGTANITNSTVSTNTAGRGGGIFTSGIGAVNLVSATIAKNVSGSSGGGVSIFSNSIVRARNTIIADNTANTGADFSGVITSQGYNLIENTDGLAGAAATDLTGVDPQFLPLDFYGGPTKTHALLVGSPVINAGSNETASATDQRGFARIIGGTIDVGAFEFGPIKPRKRRVSIF